MLDTYVDLNCILRQAAQLNGRDLTKIRTLFEKQLLNDSMLEDNYCEYLKINRV